MVAILENVFYHDGRGPELQRVRWGKSGVVLRGFEYYNPDDKYDDHSLKHLRLRNVEAYSMGGEEVHGDILATAESKAAIFRIDNSKWKDSLNQRHLDSCHHYQIMFYDEIYDVICEEIIPGVGKIR